MGITRLLELATHPVSTLRSSAMGSADDDDDDDDDDAGCGIRFKQHVPTESSEKLNVTG